MTETIRLGDLWIAVTRKAVKNVHLSVHPPAGQVTLVAPTGTRLEVARAYARRIVALSHGRIRYDGPPDGLSPALLAEIYGADPGPDNA